MTEPTPAPPVVDRRPTAATMQGRQLLSYYVLLFVFLILTRSLVVELSTQFDLAVFPTIAQGVQQALDNDAAFDSVINTCFSLLYAFLFSLPIALVYRITKEDDRFDPALGQTIVLLAMVVTAVIVVIAGDLARAFGLAGVVAAVRFRNTLDDAKDAVYVFLAIAIGMACGAKAFTVALWTSIIMTSALYFMWRYQFGRLADRLVSVREVGRKKKGGRGKKDRKQGDDNGKKPNAALRVETTDLESARRHAEKELADFGGPWRLSGVRTREDGGAALDFLGRLPKKMDPSVLVRAVLADSSVVQRVEFRDLKHMKNQQTIERPGEKIAGALRMDS